MQKRKTSKAQKSSIFYKVKGMNYATFTKTDVKVTYEIFTS